MENEMLNKPIITLLKESRDMMSDNIAIKYSHTKISYDSLFREIVKCMSSLKNIGVQEGDIVTICLPDIPQTIIAFYAITAIGAIANIIDPNCSVYDLQYYINSYDSKFIFLIDTKYHQITNIFCESLKKVIIVTEKDYLNFYDTILAFLNKNITHIVVNETEDVILWNSLLRKATPKCVQNFEQLIKNNLKATDTIIILYSDYNNEPKKGIILSHYVFNELCLETQKQFSVNYKKGDKIRTTLPFHTGYGLGIAVINSLNNGYQILLGENDSNIDYLIGNIVTDEDDKKIKLKGLFTEGDNIDTMKDVQVVSMFKYIGETGYITINP